MDEQDEEIQKAESFSQHRGCHELKGEYYHLMKATFLILASHFSLPIYSILYEK